MAEMRSRTERPSASDMSVTLSRLGKKRRLVLRFEWLTRCPIWRVLPVSSQRQAMAHQFLATLRSLGAARQTAGAGSGGTYSQGVGQRQAHDAAPAAESVDRCAAKDGTTETTHSPTRQNVAFALSVAAADRKILASSRTGAGLLRRHKEASRRVHSAEAALPECSCGGPRHDGGFCGRYLTRGGGARAA